MRLNLKVWLIENKKKSKDVAKELGLTTGYFSNILSGKRNPSIEVLDKFHELYSDTTVGAEDIYELFRKR